MKQGLTGLIGGSGLGDVLADKIEDVKFYDVATPFGKPNNIDDTFIRALEAIDE